MADACCAGEPAPVGHDEDPASSGSGAMSASPPSPVACWHPGYSRRPSAHPGSLTSRSSAGWWPASGTSPQPSTLTTGVTTTDSRICHNPVSKIPGHLQSRSVHCDRAYLTRPNGGSVLSFLHRVDQ